MSSLAVLRPGEPLAAVPSIGRAVGVEPRVPTREADATRALYERHARQIYNFCLHQLSSREEAEDAVQTTFMNAFRGLQRGIVPEAEQAWLFKIAENVCLSRRRSTWRRGRVESPNDLEVLQEIVPSRGSRADELIGLEDALEAMPENQRRAILLREWQGLSYREIGEELAISQAAVETLIFRARRTLAHGLEDSPAAKRRVFGRSANGISLGSLLGTLKSALMGGAAVKAVAVAVAAGTATVAATHAPKRVHGSHVRPAPAVDLRTSAPATAARGGVERPSPSARTHRSLRAVQPERLHRRAVTSPVTVAHGKSSPPAAPPPPPSPAAPPTPADQPGPATPPPAEQPAAEQPGAGKDAPKTAPGGPADQQGTGNAYGRDRKADEPAPPAQPPAGDKSNGKGNGKKQDGADPSAQGLAPTPPAAPASAPAAAAPPAPADPAPQQAEDHGNGHADDGAHAAGKDKGK